MAPTLTPMRSPMPPRRQFGLGGMRTVRRKRQKNAPRSSETEGQETATLVFTSHSPFPNNNNDSSDKSNSDGKAPMDEEHATSGRYDGGGKLPLLRRPAMKQKLFVHSQAEEEEESISSSPGSRAGQSIADENSNDNSSSNDYYYYAKKMKAESTNNDSDNETNNERGDNAKYYNDLEDSEDDEEEQQQKEELWDLTRVLTAKQIRQHIPIFCDTNKCTLAACCVWTSNLHPSKPWYSCLDCQKVDFKGWPTVEEGLPFNVPLEDNHRDAMLAKCTRKPKRSLRDMEYSGLLDDGDDDNDEQGEEENGISQAMTTTQYNDEEDDNSSTSSQDSEEFKHDTIVSILKNVLGCGIASVCRLRQLFPPSFFQKMDVDGTTVTKFNKDLMKAICNNNPYYSNDDNVEDDVDDDEGSMVKSFNARKTQTELSPLTEYTQRQRKSRNAREHVEYNDQEKRLAMEALLLLKWTEDDGVGAILQSGNLANVVFGISVPSTESGSTNDELLESYSFNISYNKPDHSSQVDTDEVLKGTNSFFQNLNGFQAGKSLSQALLPCKTQSTHFSQASRGDSQYNQTQMSSVDFSLSHKQSQSQLMMERSQSQLMASMSQSIRVSVKKNRGRKIPNTRYLTLRVDFNKDVRPDELPSALKQSESSSSSSCRVTSPMPITGRNTAKSAASKDSGFIITPLGRIRENGYSGLCVDMFAETKRESKENEEIDDDKSLHFTQKPHASADLDEGNNDQPLTQFSTAKDPVDGETDDIDDFHPLTQRPEKEEEVNESNVEKVAAPKKAAKADETEAHVETQLGEEPGKENMEVVVGSKAFGIPYDLKGKSETKTYIMCDVWDHRITKSTISGKKTEEYKCVFYSDEFTKAGQNKQWVESKRLISYNQMVKNIEDEFGDWLNERQGEVLPNIIEGMAEHVNVDPSFVHQIVATKKRKSTSHETSSQREQHKKLKV